MKKSHVLALTRHALTLVGGVLLVPQDGDNDMLMQAVGSLVTAIGIIWSLVEKRGRVQ